jgi:transposase InsO family protein
MNVSRPTATKWWGRYLADPEGQWWLDHSSRPHRSPNQTPRKVARKILSLRRNRKLGPARIAGQVDVPASTVHRVLVRHGMNRLAWMDRPTGRVIRRYEHDRPGNLVHVDIKKMGKIPRGGGWRAHGRATTNTAARKRQHIGYSFVHSMVDDHSRVAYSEIHDDERAVTAIAFFRRARVWFARRGVNIGAVLTDNGPCYRSRDFRAELAEAGIAHRWCRPYRPQTNGKVERFNRTLLDEWAYARNYRSEAQRRRALDKWLHLYNHHRCHTALGGQPPMSRVNNLPRQYN